MAIDTENRHSGDIHRTIVSMKILTEKLLLWRYTQTFVTMEKNKEQFLPLRYNRYFVHKYRTIVRMQN